MSSGLCRFLFCRPCLQCLQEYFSYIIHDLRYIRQYVAVDIAILDANALRYRCIFTMATLMYKLLSSSLPSNLRPFLIPCNNKYNTTDRRFLEFPQFSPFLHKSKIVFHHCFGDDHCQALLSLKPDEFLQYCL